MIDSIQCLSNFQFILFFPFLGKSVFNFLSFLLYMRSKIAATYPQTRTITHITTYSAIVFKFHYHTVLFPVLEWEKLTDRERKMNDKTDVQINSFKHQKCTKMFRFMFAHGPGRHRRVCQIFHYITASRLYDLFRCYTC